MSTCSLSAIQIPPKRTRMRRRNGSTYSNLLGSGSGTRKRPIAPVESGPCCQDSPIALHRLFDDRRALHVLQVFLTLERGPGGKVPVRMNAPQESGDLRNLLGRQGARIRAHKLKGP